ncbi:MAG TPA: FAD-dependent oxidoreductase [Gaiellaceae bacterium]
MQRALRERTRRLARRCDVVVVGAGPAGLAVSARLAQTGRSHVVLERGRIASTWRTQRWDSFRLNTPRWMNRVAGELLPGAPGSFGTADALIAGLERLAEALPVYERVEVLRARPDGGAWELETTGWSFIADDLVVASGFQNVPRKPSFADDLPAELTQLHVADYRRPDDVQGAALVVGGGQSGLQVAEDLLLGGRRVFLATSRVGRLPRRYRGRDAFEWLRDGGQLDLPTEQADPTMIGGAPPQISGDGQTLSYQRLAKDGATLLGRATGWDGRRLTLASDLGSNVWYADEVSAMFREMWDRRGDRRLAPAPEADPADEPARHLYGLEGPSSIDLAANGISTIVWATGFGPSIDWLPAGALDDRGRPQLPGLHAIGAPWLTHRTSASLYGMASDADRVASAIAAVDLRIAA